MAERALHRLHLIRHKLQFVGTCLTNHYALELDAYWRILNQRGVMEPALLRQDDEDNDVDDCGGGYGYDVDYRGSDGNAKARIHRAAIPEALPRLYRHPRAVRNLSDLKALHEDYLEAVGMVFFLG
jgi:hypothetical protein|tara:strand:- start:98 stop:475 length:378 start_codon:yes stop_codon:yes gene_type:complete